MALLTVDEFRALYNTSLGDAPLQLLLNAAEDAITAVAGAPGERTEVLLIDAVPRHSVIELKNTPATIDEVRIAYGYPDELVLDTDDYLQIGRFLYRLATGTNPDDWWYGPVSVTHTPASDLNNRKRVQYLLVKLDFQFQPGLRQFTVGKHSEQSGSQAGTLSYADQRAELLAELAGAVNPVFA